MRSKSIDDAAHNSDGTSRKTFAVILETGDQIVAGLTAIAKRQSLAASHFTAIGAFETALLGYFDWGKRAI
jgi:uncharacterized protein